MSYEDGWAAINLEMPKRVPRTEYSAADYHWPLISKVTGTTVTEQSPVEVRRKATEAFVKAWNYDFWWSILIDSSYLGKYVTDMGHAAFAEDGADKSDVGKPAFASPEEVLAFDPLSNLPSYDHRDLVEQFNRHYRENCARFPEAVNMTGVYITFISGFVDMLGWDMLLLSAGTDPKAFAVFTDRYVEWVSQFFLAAAECDAPLIMVHDDIVWTSGPFIHPDWYRAHVFPALKRCFAPLKEAGKKIVFTSDGDFTLFIDDIAAAGADGFVLEPITDMELVVEHYGKTHFFIGNVDTRALLLGTREDIRNEVVRCMNIGKASPGFFLAVGNHIPANTPVENALYYNECYEELMWR